MSLIAYAFPDYDDTLPVIEGFSDYSYKNDACPCIGKELGEHQYLLLYCDYKNSELSECHNQGDAIYYRYCLMLDLPMEQFNAKILGNFETIEQVKSFIAEKTLNDFINMEEA
jgi:hypothetical protein